MSTIISVLQLVGAVTTLCVLVGSLAITSAVIIEL